MQIPVLFAILSTLLSAEGVVKADDLAQKYEISKRTVYRYVATLSESGVPVESHLGRGGGWSILPSYKLKSTYLTEGESQFLFDLLAGSPSDEAKSLTNKLSGLLRKQQ